MIIEKEYSYYAGNVFRIPETYIIIVPSKPKKKPRHRIYDLNDEFGITMCFVMFLAFLFVLGICFGILWQGLYIYPFKPL